MKYVKVVVGLAVEGPFDYHLCEKPNFPLRAGIRLKVHFRNKVMTAYAVGFSQHSDIQQTKPVLKLIDQLPVLDSSMLALTQGLARYFACSRGEAIETALPESLRKGRPVNLHTCAQASRRSSSKVTLVHAAEREARWEVYLAAIKETLTAGQSVIVLVPDVQAAIEAQKRIGSELALEPVIAYRKEPQEFTQWIKIHEGTVKVVIGARSVIFSPVPDLGLIIIDEEQDSVYKQEQVPHYHAREVAWMRAKIQKADLLMGSASPSLEMMHLKDKNVIAYTYIPRKDAYPQVNVIDAKHFVTHRKKFGSVISKYVEESIAEELASGGKVLIFLNRKGYATFAYCHKCATVAKCPRCNINLAYYYKDNSLVCNYCNFKLMPAPRICPHCNEGYMRYSGMGTERMESELSRLFPQARIRRLDEEAQERDADIYIATQSVVKYRELRFDLVVVAAIDNSLNRFDFRASEKTFSLLTGLSSLAKKRMLILTRMPHHYCIRSLAEGNHELFYKEELRFRKQLGMPPFKHFVTAKLRGRDEVRVQEAAERLFDELKKNTLSRVVKVLSVSPCERKKLRGNFYWQVLLSSKRVPALVEFLKSRLKKMSFSGIIVTVDVDPL
ncbi:MAG: primosomal protein N' [Candidatus Omnitrophota bacterium]|nr:MAG: primosomal protein N' [Candidatus Omnitrophota bacterium]